MKNILVSALLGSAALLCVTSVYAGPNTEYVKCIDLCLPKNSAQACLDVCMERKFEQGSGNLVGSPKKSLASDKLQKMTPTERGEFLQALSPQARSEIKKLYPELFKELPSTRK